MKETIFAGKGTDFNFEDYVDFINYVFGFSGESKDFGKLLPKLYREELCPQASNYVVAEDGKLRAAVGAYDHSIKVCGQTLKCRGIGNVAVHPYHRSKGYMKVCMNNAISDMIADGIDMSTLGGRRQRYNYFGYDRSGSCVEISFTPDNIRHTYTFDYPQKFKITQIQSDSCRELDDIYKLMQMQAYKPMRPRNELYNILASWHMRTYAAYDGDRFVGYCAVRDKTINEIILCDSSELVDLLLSVWKQYGVSAITSVALPSFYTDYIEQLYRFGEGCVIHYNMSYLVLNYKKVIDAFMNLKSTYEKLPSGSLTLLIHGKAGDERLSVSVIDGDIRVEPTDAPADFELEHLEAMSFLFAHTCPKRLMLPDFAKIWFPLPIWMYQADEV